MNNTNGTRKWLKPLPLVVPALLGAVGGYFYYQFIGCVSGTCAITSNPYISTIYGAMIGALLGSIITPRKKGTDEARSNIWSGSPFCGIKPLPAIRLDRDHLRRKGVRMWKSCK